MSYSDDINERETGGDRQGMLSANTTVLGSNSQNLATEIWNSIPAYTHDARSNTTANYTQISSDQFSVKNESYIQADSSNVSNLYWKPFAENMQLNDVVRLYDTTTISKQVSAKVPYYYWEGNNLISSNWNVDAIINELITTDEFNSAVNSDVETIQPAAASENVEPAATSTPSVNNDKEALLITNTKYCDYLTRLEYKKLPPGFQKELGDYINSIKWTTKSWQQDNEYLFRFRYKKQVNAWNSDTTETQIDITMSHIAAAQNGSYDYDISFDVLDDPNIYFIAEDVIIPQTNVKLSRFIKECIINGDGSLYGEITAWSSDVVKSVQQQVGYLLSSYKEQTYKLASPDYVGVYNYFFYYNDPTVTPSKKKMLILSDKIIDSILIGHYPTIGYGDATIQRTNNGGNAVYVIQDTTYCDYLSRLIGQNLPPNLQVTLGNYFNSIVNNTFTVFAEGYDSNSIVVGYWFKWMEPSNQWTSGGKREFITTSVQIQKLLDQTYPYTVISVDDSAVYEITDDYYRGILSKGTLPTNAELKDLAQYMQYNKGNTKTIFNSSPKDTVYYYKYRDNNGTLMLIQIPQGAIDIILTWSV